jgi:hypothetical protein
LGKKGAAYSEDDGPQQTSFTPETDPSSDTNDGEASGIAVTAIGPEAEMMSFLVQGAGEPVVSATFLVGPNPTTTGYVTAYLPEQGGEEAVLEVFDLIGRRVARREVPPGANQYGLSIPTNVPSGTFLIVYRAPTVRYHTPLIYLRSESYSR